jgi:hypothetical protein
MSAAVPCELNIAYGAHEKQTLDLFPAKANRGLLIFIHRGCWRSLDKDDFCFFVARILNSIREGIAPIAPNRSDWSHFCSLCSMAPL